MWRDQDEALLERLEDEELLGQWALARVDGRAPAPGFHPRAAGLLSAIRGLPGADAARSGGGAALARWLELGPLVRHPPALLHHMALAESALAVALEGAAPELGARAWVRSVAAWMALEEEGHYLSALARAVLSAPAVGKPRVEVHADDVGARMVTEAIKRLEAQAAAGARSLDRRGRAALLALSWIGMACELSGVGPAGRGAATLAAERAYGAALEGALAPVAEALEEARGAGDLSRAGGAVLTPAIAIWEWAGRAEHVEQFAVTKLADVGWELYRAERWDALRQLMTPFQLMFDHLAARIERDPSRIAYAAPCAQMYVFLADVQRDLPRRTAMAERAVAVCPSHRNGRLTLAALLLDDACRALSDMGLVARRGEIERCAALVTRAEALYPRSRDLPRAKELLARARAAPLSL